MLNALIAVPSAAPGGLDVAMSSHFGHCDAYTLVQISEGQVENVTTLPNAEHAHGSCMVPVQMLAAQGVTGLLAGGMGVRPLMGFRQVGIDVHFAQQCATVGQAVQQFIEGKLPLFGEQNTCGGGGGQCGGH